MFFTTPSVSMHSFALVPLLAAKEGGGTLLGRCSSGRKLEAATCMSCELPILTALLHHSEIDIGLKASSEDTTGGLLPTNDIPL